jgi:hypothetical protein
MNNTEFEYAKHLELRKMAGEIRCYEFEGHKFRLADNTFYTPDFCVVTPTHVEFHEVKGTKRVKGGTKAYCREDARMKIKIAAELRPWYRWCITWRGKNGWHWEWFN